jgi:hypothetical protein
MNKRRPRNWLAKLFYITICLVFLGALYLVVEAFIPKDFDLSTKFMTNPFRGNTSQREVRERALSGPVKEKILLLLNQEKKFEKSKIIYRGLEGSSAFKIDVVIPELDPNAYYRYRIHIEDAKKGFRLGGQNFKLISARKSAAQIWHFKL